MIIKKLSCCTLHYFLSLSTRLKKRKVNKLSRRFFSLPDRKMTSDSRRFCQFRVIKAKNNGRRRRIKVRRLSSFEKSEGYGVESKKNGVLLSLPLPAVKGNNGCVEKYKVVVNSVEKGSHGAVSIIGKRPEMEDAVGVETGFVKRSCGENYDFFGVYDGHGGLQVAEACSERLHRVVAEEVEREGERGEGVVRWERVMVEAFERMDEEVNGSGDEALDTVGSTAVVAVVGDKEVVVANCGDSRAVLCRGGSPVALSVDHKPERPDELRRIEAAGGRVINWNGYRVLGVLCTSRSIGDQYLKPFVVAVPEVTITKRTNEDEFLILASDGLWDVVSNEFACQVVRKCLDGRLRRRRTSPDATTTQSYATEAAAVLAELAVARGSHDNISVIVVELNKSSNFAS